MRVSAVLAARLAARLAATLVAAACTACAASSTGWPEVRGQVTAAAAAAPTSSRPWSMAADKHAARRQTTPTASTSAAILLAPNSRHPTWVQAKLPEPVTEGTQVPAGRLTTAVRDILFSRPVEKFEPVDVTKRVEEDSNNRLTSPAEAPTAALTPAVPAHQSNEATEATSLRDRHLSSTSALEPVSRHGEEVSTKAAWIMLSDILTKMKRPSKPENRTVELTEVSSMASRPSPAISHNTTIHPARATTVITTKIVPTALSLTSPASLFQSIRGVTTVFTSPTRDTQFHFRTKGLQSAPSTPTSTSSADSIRAKASTFSSPHVGESPTMKSWQTHQDSEYTFGMNPSTVSGDWIASQSTQSPWKGIQTKMEALLTGDTPSTTLKNKLVFELTTMPSLSTSREIYNTEAKTEYTGKRRHATSSNLAPNEALKPARKAIVITFPKLKSLPLDDSEIKPPGAHAVRGDAASQSKMSAPLGSEVSTFSTDTPEKVFSSAPLSYVEQQTTKFVSESTVAQQLISSTESARIGEESTGVGTNTSDDKQGDEGRGKQLVLTVLVSYLKEGHPLVNETITFNLDKRDNSTNNTQLIAANPSNDWTETSRTIASAVAQLPSLQRVLKGFVLATPTAKQEDSATPFPPTLSHRELPLRTTENMLPIIGLSDVGTENFSTTLSPSSDYLGESIRENRTHSKGSDMSINVVQVAQEAEESKRAVALSQTNFDDKSETGTDIILNVGEGTEVNHENIAKNANKVVLYVDTGDCVPEVAEKISTLENRSNADSGKQIVIEMNCYQPEYSSSEQMSSNSSDKKNATNAETGVIIWAEDSGTYAETTIAMKTPSTVKAPVIMTPPAKSNSRQTIRTDLAFDVKSPSASSRTRRYTGSSTITINRRQPSQVKLKGDNPDSTPRTDTKSLQDFKRKGTRSRLRKTSGSHEAAKKTPKLDAGKSILLSTTPGSDISRVTRMVKLDSTKSSTLVSLHLDDDDQIGNRMDARWPVWTTSRAKDNDPTDGRTDVKQTTRKLSTEKGVAKARRMTMRIRIKTRKIENETTDDKHVIMSLVPPRLPEPLALAVTRKIQAKTSPRNEIAGNELLPRNDKDNLILDVADAAPRIDELSIDPSQITFAKSTTIPPWGFLKLFSLLEGFDLGSSTTDPNRIKSWRNQTTTVTPTTLTTGMAFPVSSKTTTTTTSTYPTTASRATSEDRIDTDNVLLSQTDTLVESQPSTEALVLQTPKPDDYSSVESGLSYESENSAIQALTQLSTTTASFTASNIEALRTTRSPVLLTRPRLKANRSRGYRLYTEVSADLLVRGRGRLRATTSRAESTPTQADACENLCKPRYRTVCAQVGSLTRTFNSLCEVKVEGCVVGESPKILHTGPCNKLRKKKTKVTIEQEEEVPENESVDDLPYKPPLPPLPTVFVQKLDT